MENCTGGEFIDKILDKGYITEEEAKFHIKSLFSAIYHCHKLNICHRDLKPDNFLLTTKDNDAILKVIDFGLSKKFGSEGNFKAVVGTP